MGVSKQPAVTVDANQLYGLFPRYILIAMHIKKLCEAVYSNRVWEEAAKVLCEKAGLSEGQIEMTLRYLENVGFRREDLDNDDQEKIDLLKHVNEKDRHVLYLAFISKSRFLVTADKKFRREDINHEDHQRLEFYYPVEAVSLDEFLCYLMEECEDRYKDLTIFLDAAKEAMVYLRKNTVKDIFGWMKLQCPNASSKLLPYFEEIEAAVEEERQAIAKRGKLR